MVVASFDPEISLQPGMSWCNERTAFCFHRKFVEEFWAFSRDVAFDLVFHFVHFLFY